MTLFLFGNLYLYTQISTSGVGPWEYIRFCYFMSLFISPSHWIKVQWTAPRHGIYHNNGCRITA